MSGPAPPVPPRKRILKKSHSEADALLLKSPIKFSSNCSDITEDPETVIGPGVDIKGDLEFDRLLRIDGKFEGRLISTGNLIVGSAGNLIGDVENISTLVIDGGHVFGNVCVEQLIMRGRSVVKGNITCKSLVADSLATIIGVANIHALSPETIDENGDIMIAPPKVLSQHVHNVYFLFNFCVEKNRFD